MREARQGNAEYHPPMNRLVLYFLSLAAITGLAVGIVLLRIRVDPLPLAAVLGALALVLSAFAGLAYPGLTRQLRHWATASAWAAFGMPFLLLVPYFLFTLGTHTFSPVAAAKLAAYILVPTALLLPDRLRSAENLGWRDLAAMLALALPVGAHWLQGIWAWPEDLYFFRPLITVCVGGYGFLVLRNLEGVGYRIVFRRGDFVDGFLNFLAFGLLAIPLGLYLNFLHPHASHFSPGHFGFQLYGIYLTIALPEEFLFRGILQNFLVKTIRHPRGSLYGLLIASVVFGAAHLHHPPVPNWRYGILATLAGIFYGNAYRAKQRLAASALTHTLVDTTWHFWF